MMKKILITGSSGFLGKSLCKELLLKGYQVKWFDKNIGDDILNFAHLLESLKGCNICIHLAAVSDLYVADSNPQLCKDVNITGTKNIALACLKTGTRLLYASTCCAYGNNGETVSEENSPLVPTELYAETKLEGEQIIKNSGCEYNILRLATFYGAEMRHTLATSVFLRKALAEQTIEIHGDGMQTRCYTHVEDIVCGIRIILDNVDAPKVINISDETPYTVNELVEIVRKVSGKEVVVRNVEDRAGQIKSSVIKSQRLKQLGWKPKWDLHAGLKDCMSVYEKSHHTD